MDRIMYQKYSNDGTAKPSSAANFSGYTENDFIAFIAWFTAKYQVKGFSDNIDANYMKAIDVFNRYCNDDNRR